LLCAAALAQDPARDAYRHLHERRLDDAVRGFQEALRTSPSNPALHKDLAYTLLRTGERAEALEHFENAARLDPGDEQTRLEAAFLCYELKRERDARVAFEKLQTSPNDQVAATARQAFENIDRPLREGIARWQAALEAEPGQWSAHEELARLAARRNDLPLAERHYREAFRLKPDKKDLLWELVLVLRAAGEEQQAAAALVALRFGAEPRLAERARALLPARHPYPYEFRDAVSLDPTNAPLHRELVYLLQAMGLHDEATRELAILEARHPVRPAVSDARLMGFRSLEKSYLKDALRYLRVAQEEHPADAEVAYRLGLTLNLLGQDDEALEWLGRAARLGSSDARRSYRALRASTARFRVSAWTLPMYSSRWATLFVYSQVKTEWKLGPVRPYLSLRANGDVRGEVQGAWGPLHLSENALITAGGLGFPLTHGFYLWGEAGQAFSRLGSRPDFRGGLSFLRLARLPARAFVENSADAVFVSRFHNNLLVYSQNRIGWTLFRSEKGALLEAYGNLNLTTDTRREAWANFVEAGPGIKLRWPGLPPGFFLRTDLVRGVYTLPSGGLLPPNFWDLRIGAWYAVTR
jgi:Flp pilus assembly protein TadD